MLLEFTEGAKMALKRLLEEHDPEPGQVIRMVTGIQGEHHLTFGALEPDDQVLEHEGVIVLVVKERISSHMCEHHPGATLDVEETEDGLVLVMRNEGEETRS